MQSRIIWDEYMAELKLIIAIIFMLFLSLLNFLGFVGLIPYLTTNLYILIMTLLILIFAVGYVISAGLLLQKKKLGFKLGIITIICVIIVSFIDLLVILFMPTFYPPAFVTELLPTIGIIGFVITTFIDLIPLTLIYLSKSELTK